MALTVIVIAGTCGLQLMLGLAASAVEIALREHSPCHATIVHIRSSHSVARCPLVIGVAEGTNATLRGGERA